MTFSPDPLRALARREFIMRAASGTIITGLAGGLFLLSDRLTARARAESLPDGRPRLPPGQRVIEALKPMGGEPGDPRPANFRLKIHGEVEHPFELTFAELVGSETTALRADVHCVTGWTVLGARWKGVRIQQLAERAKVRRTARYVIFEAAHGYTANTPIAQALGSQSMVTWELDERRLPRTHGGPVRGLVPELYFWKSAKWLTGIRFVARDQPGYWERRGYHNHGDPWLEQRYG